MLESYDFLFTEYDNATCWMVLSDFGIPSMNWLDGYVDPSMKNIGK